MPPPIPSFRELRAQALGRGLLVRPPGRSDVFFLPSLKDSFLSFFGAPRWQACTDEAPPTFEAEASAALNAAVAEDWALAHRMNEALDIESATANPEEGSSVGRRPCSLRRI